MADATPDPDAAAMRARLDQLSAELDKKATADAAAQPRPGASGGKSDSGSAMAKGMRAASELVGGVLVGGFIGWQLDSWLHTKPWLSLLFFILGAAGGLWNVVREAMQPPGGDKI